eukprot:3223244-Pleurochrysis_carterae.AAC.1
MSNSHGFVNYDNNLASSAQPLCALQPKNRILQQGTAMRPDMELARKHTVQEVPHEVSDEHIYACLMDF